VSEIGSIGTLLLDERATATELASACARLHDICSDTSGLRFERDTGGAHITRFADGLALGSHDAANCVQDTKRTVAFVRGLWDAVACARERFPKDVIEVVYAGTGPHASLALPLMQRLNPANVQFTLIEVDRDSARLLEKLLASLNLESHVRDVVVGDAACYTHATAIHVAITETMQRALAQEPFVAIARNLRLHLAEGGLFVPERVAVSVASIDAAAERGHWQMANLPSHRRLATLLEISASGTETIFDSDRSRPVRVSLPDEPHESWVGLLTEVDAFGEHSLKTYESGLTVPEILWRLSPIGENAVVEFQYRLGMHPGFTWRRVVELPST